jgi:hypothetical protein
MTEKSGAEAASQNNWREFPERRKMDSMTYAPARLEDSGSQALTGFLCRNHEHTENNRFLWATLPCNQPDGRNDLRWNFIRNPLD